MARDAIEDDGQDPDPRFSLANERTFLAWNRTALALIGGGLAAGHLLEFDADLLRLGVALPPIVLGALIAATSHRRWRSNELALRRNEPMPASRPPALLAVGIAVLAVVVGLVVVLDAS